MEYTKNKSADGGLLLLFLFLDGFYIGRRMGDLLDGAALAAVSASDWRSRMERTLSCMGR